MLNINFEGKPNLWELLNFSKEHNIDIYELLHTAFHKNALTTEEPALLLNFIESTKYFLN